MFSTNLDLHLDFINLLFFLGSGSSGSESDSEENTLAPPKLAPSNQESPIFNNLLKNLNNSKASGTNNLQTPLEIHLKEEASIEYSSGMGLFTLV